MFAGYCKNKDGTACLAKKQGAFRSVDDRIIGINGASTVGKSYDETLDMLRVAKARGDSFVTLSMDSDRTALSNLVQRGIPN